MTKLDDPNYRRLRILYVDEAKVFAYFAKASGSCKFLSAYEFGNIPEDAELVAVHHSFERNEFAFTVRHESFDVVLPGTQIPSFAGELLISNTVVFRRVK